MAAAEGLVQVPTDGVGKRIEATAITIPAGTVITNGDGTLTTLASDTVVYRQVVAIGDPDYPGLFAEVSGEAGRGRLKVTDEGIELLQSMNEKLTMLVTLLSMALGTDAQHNNITEG